MIDHVWQKLDLGARLSVPFVTAILCTMLGVMTWPLPWLGTVSPAFALMALYCWTVHRPDLFPPWMAFAIGILNDIVNYLPLGVSPLVFVVAQQVILRQRRFFAGHSFLMVWTGFMPTVLAVMLAEWLLLCIARWESTPILPLIMQVLLSIAIFPLPYWLLVRLQRVVAAAS